MVMRKSAVSQILCMRKPTCENLLFSKLYSTMASWVVEKQKYLSMDMNTRRKNYKTYIELNDIPTWREYVGIKGANITPKANGLPGITIDGSKNRDLADKISFYTGDITALEVGQVII